MSNHSSVGNPYCHPSHSSVPLELYCYIGLRTRPDLTLTSDSNKQRRTSTAVRKRSRERTVCGQQRTLRPAHSVSRCFAITNLYAWPSRPP